MSDDLGIETDGLSQDKVDILKKSVATAIRANSTTMHQSELEKAISSFSIQRRGAHYPGDTGQNFGLGGAYGYEAGYFSTANPYANIYPGSYFFNAHIGGGLPVFGGGRGGYFGLGQGSHAAFRANTRAAHYKMGMCVSAYKGFGLAKNVIDLMANFASEGLTIQHPNKTIKRFLERWAFNVDLKGRVKDILRYYYKYGNVFVYRTMGRITDKAYNRMRRSAAKLDAFKYIEGFTPVSANTVEDPEQQDNIDDAEENAKKPLGEKVIPWRYTLLNPFQMELRGSKFFGESRWVFVLDETTATDAERGRLDTHGEWVDFLEDSEVNLPPEFKKALRTLSPSAPDEEQNDFRVVDLNQKNLYTFHYMKDDHEDWAEPLLWPVMADIFYKNKLREMDISVCDSVINSITIFKLGNMKEGYIPDDEVFDKFAEFLRAPTQAMQMVWNDAISIESSFPPVDKILGMSKYESVDRDILRGIGIPDTLIGGAAKSNFSTGFLGVRTLLERLEEGREAVERWLLKELEYVVRSLGIRRPASVKFGKMSLRDEQKEKQLILQLLDRNIISIEAVLEAFGEDFTIELERMKEEEKIREETGLLKKHSPYPDPMTDMDEETKMQLDSMLKLKEQRENHKLKQKSVKQRGDDERRNARERTGRPPGTDGIPQEVQRETKPQGMAWLMEYEQTKASALRHVSNAEEAVASVIMSTFGKKNKRSLDKTQAKAVEDITFVVASRVSMGQEIDEDKVKATLKANPTIDKLAHDVYAEINEKTTLEERRVAMATAITYAHLERKYNADR